jgi:TonB family protein
MFDRSPPNKATQDKIKRFIILMCVAITINVDITNQAISRNAAVALDVANPIRDYDSTMKPYMISLRARIENYWLNGLFKQGLRAIVHFEITDRGALENVVLLRSSKQSKFDAKIISAISKAAPFDAPPQPGGLKIDATFDDRFVDLTDLERASKGQLARKGPMQQDKSKKAEPVYNPPYFPQQQLPPQAFQQPPYHPESPAPYRNLRAPEQVQNQQPGIAPYQAPGLPPAPKLTRRFETQLPPEWATSGQNGTHRIKVTSKTGKFLLLDDDSLWESEDAGKSQEWSSGDEVLTHDSFIIDITHSGEKVQASVKERACALIAVTKVTGDFEGSDKPIILDNNMIFEATSYHYHYGYHLDALVLGCKFMGHILYKVIVDDDIYNATRLR